MLTCLKFIIFLTEIACQKMEVWNEPDTSATQKVLTAKL